MSLWKKTDDAASSPKWGPALNKTKANTANQTAAFGNTSPLAIGVFGVSIAEAKAPANDGKLAHPGWVARRLGTGPIASVAITSGGANGYTNTDTFTVVAPTGGVNATGTIGTNGAGVITSVTLVNPGKLFSAKTNAVVITTAAGVGATLTATAGRRAGRVNVETLVAMGSITGDAADDAIFPNS